MTDRLAVLLRFFAAVLLLASPALAAETSAWADSEMAYLLPLYEHLHSHPEVSFEEKETAARIAQELKLAGCEVQSGIGGHGVVGLLKNGDGPTVMWRTDLDALPVTEETGLPYASRVQIKAADGSVRGVMHACGHDIHMTTFVGLARLLAAHRDAWSGTAMFVGQPAEELGNGAKRMLDDGLFTKIRRPDFALALHCDSEMPAGTVGYRAGYVMANADTCDIVVKGQGGHGSKPEACIDPIVQAAQLILDLQTIVSRETPPLEPAVITVGSIHAGTKHNIIPNECRLQLTIRSYTPEVRQQLHDAIRRKAKAVAASFRAAEPTVEFNEGTPATRNDDDLVQRVVPALADVVGDDRLKAADRTMGAEDFSFYGLAGVPICMYRLGTVTPAAFEKAKREGTPLPSLHSSKYAPDAKTSLKVGVATATAAMISLMPRK
jgi:amidohydrolase